MWIAIHPRGVIAGAAFVRRLGERGYAMPNLKSVQDSGVHWGFGTDAFEVNQYRPFTTLGLGGDRQAHGAPAARSS